MNIFVLDVDPVKAAEYHCDKHVIKMILESAQILCTVHHLIDTSPDIPYRKTHTKHPCVLWTTESIANYRWLCKLAYELCREYTYRYDKVHKTEDVIHWCTANEPILPSVKQTPFAQAMPEFCQGPDAVEAYQKYYAICKKHLHFWKKRSIPNWIHSFQSEVHDGESNLRI